MYTCKRMIMEILVCSLLDTINYIPFYSWSTYICISHWNSFLLGNNDLKSIGIDLHGSFWCIDINFELCKFLRFGIVDYIVLCFGNLNFRESCSFVGLCTYVRIYQTHYLIFPSVHFYIKYRPLRIHQETCILDKKKINWI
jgi:hypothetical protein